MIRSAGTVHRTIGLGMILAVMSVLACGDGGRSTDSQEYRRSTAISLQLNLENPPGRVFKALAPRAVGDPDVCGDYLIDTISVEVYWTSDNSEAASARQSCLEHSLTVADVPAGENLYLVCKGITSSGTSWQGRVDDVVVNPGQNKNVGLVTMAYIGVDAAAPEIASLFPRDGDTDVDLRAWVMVVFNEALAPSSIPDESLTVNADGTPVPGSLAYDAATYTLRFMPDDPAGLAAETTYSAIFDPGTDSAVTDTAGRRFVGNQNWQFTTGGADDTSPPRIVATSPADGAMSVAQKTTLSVQFSEPMDPSSFTAGVFKLSWDQDAVNGAAVYDEQTRTLSMTPDFALDAMTLHTAVVGTQAVDLAGNPLPASHSWQFWTRGPLNDLITGKTGGGSGRVAGPRAGIDCGDICHADVAAGTTITLEAVADEDSRFIGWAGDFCVGEAGPCTFTMHRSTTVTANFALKTYTITATVIPEDGAAGTVSPAQVTVNHGADQVIDIVAKPFHSASELMVDGNPVSPASAFLFEKVTENHTIQATFQNNKLMRSDDTNGGCLFDHSVHNSGQEVWESSTDHILYLEAYGAAEPLNITQAHDITGYVSSPQVNMHGHVVWSGKPGLSEDNNVYFYDGSKMTNLSQTHNATGDQFRPQISDSGNVVWHSTTFDEQSSERYFTVYYYDGQDVITIYGPSTDTYTTPEINSNGHVVWSGLHESEDHIYYYNGSETTVISDSPVNMDDLGGDHRYPKINDNGHVVWRSHNGKDTYLYCYDGSNATRIAGPIKDFLIDIGDNGNIVWVGTDDNIYYKNGSTTTNITPDVPGLRHQLRMNAKGHVAWFNVLPENKNMWDIYYYDGSGVFNISNNTTEYWWSLGLPEFAMNDDGYVVWSGKRSSVCESYHSYY